MLSSQIKVVLFVNCARIPRRIQRLAEVLRSCADVHLREDSGCKLSKVLIATSVFFSLGHVLAQPPYLSPTALASAPDGRFVYVACSSANQIAVFDTVACKVDSTIPVPGSPSGLTTAPDGKRLYVTCAAPQSLVCVIDPVSQRVVELLPAGHTAMAPVLARDGQRLFVCDRFNNDVSVFDLVRKRILNRVPVQRQPVAADLTKDGKYLLVANQLPNGCADITNVAAVVSVIDVTACRLTKELHLPNGSGSLHDIRISPDGKYGLVTHLVARFNRLPTRVTGGWMHGNALTIIDVARMEIRSTVLLDDAYSGAANPWGVAWSNDGGTVVVAHSGTQEVSVIDFLGLVDRLSLPPPSDPVNGIEPGLLPPNEQPDYLPFFVGKRTRVKLPEGDLGPRAVLIAGQTAYVANYFSDTLSVLDLGSEQDWPEKTKRGNVEPAKPTVGQVSTSSALPKTKSVPLGPKHEMSLARKGELYFNDARLCYDGWQGCASCHPGDARCDGLNWDLLNDGIGNPKNTKSLLLSFQTPPAMSLGVRETAGMAVRSGIRHILFTEQPEEVAAAIDEYLKSLKPVPSPYLLPADVTMHGFYESSSTPSLVLSSAAKRGERIFRRAGCAGCHPPGLFTDLHSHNVGTRGRFDQATDQFDTPTLVELWRTAPYLHDGSAATVREVVTSRNPQNQHGQTTKLSHKEIDDLCVYLLSL